MAEDIKTPDTPPVKPDTTVKPDVLASQDIMGKSTKGEPNPETSDALDQLAAAKSKEKEDAAVKPTPPEVTPEPGAKPSSDADAKAKAEADAKAKAEADAARAKADDLFKDVQLPPGARPKSAEAFAAIKLKAAQEISNAQAKLAEAEKALKERDEKLKNPIPPELESEIKELRAFRARFDVEADPKWKEFDNRAKSTDNFIYAQLKKHPEVVTPDVLKKIEEYGGPSKVNMDKILSAINDPTTSRIVQAKLADIAQIEYEKQTAVEAAKKDSEGYVQQRSKEMSEAGGRHTQATAQHAATLLTQLDWYAEKQPDEKATEEDKKRIAEDNKFFKETDEQVRAALKDNSPEMRAILLTGMAQLFKSQRDNDTLKKDFDAAKKQVEELTSKLDRFKSASTVRLRESIPPGDIPKPKESDNFHKPATQALDELRDRVLAERAAKGQ